MKRKVVVLFLLLSVVTLVYAFQIQQYGYDFQGFFIELYTLDNLPTVYTDKSDEFIDIKIYDLDREDLTGAVTIADVGVSGEPMYSLRRSVSAKQRLKLTKEALAGLRLIVVSSKSKTAKLMTSYRTVGAQLLRHEDGAMLRLWTRDAGKFVDQFSLYRLRDGSLIGKTDNGLFTFETLPPAEETILVHSPVGSLLWKPNASDYSLPSKYTSLTFTDRPAYKAGERVNFRSFLREITPEGYVVPQLGELKVEITDPLERSVYSEKLRPDSFGSVSGSYTTYPEITRGSYKLVVRWDGGENYYYFQIADYKKPTFFTLAEIASPSVRKGEVVSIDVKSEYYFGDPVSLAKVDYTIYKGGQYIDSGTTRLDGMGETVIGYGGALEPGYYYAIVTVSDDTGMQSRTSVDFKVVQGTFDFSSEYALNDKSLIAKVQTKANDGIPVSKSFQIKVWYEQTVTLLEGTDSVQKKLKINVFKEELTTDNGGVAELVIDLSEVPEDNLVYVELSGAPAGEPEVIAKSSLYVSGYYDYYGSIVLDKIEPAAPGGKAKVSFYASQAMDVWVIADFSGAFSQFAQTTVPGKNTLEIEVPRGYAYESFSLYLVSFKEYQLNYYWTVKVDSSTDEYTVKVLTQEKYAPGDRVNLRVIVTDPTGKGANVGLTLAVVSKAMLSLFEGERDFWKDSLNNPFYGGFSTVRVSDLYYSPYPSISSLKGLLESRPPVGESKVLASEAMGMGERGDSGGLASDVKARKLFSDSALWSVGAFTDDNGLAEISFSLPEDLDTWTVRALAADTKGSFAYARESFETWKPMTVTSFLPEFVTAGDSVQFVFSLKNNTDSQMPVLSGFYTDGTLIEERGSVVPAFESSTFRYEVKVPDLSPDEKGETLKVKFLARGSSVSDGVEYEIPIKPRYTYRKFGELDFLEGKRTLRFSENSVGFITLSNTIDPILLEAIRFLVDYPYGCVEQTMSKFLPAVAAFDLLEGADRAFIEKVDEVILKSLERLYGYQHYDGGWGWWKGDNTEPFMTSYVMYGFYLALENGLELNEDSIRLGYSAMKNLYAAEPDPFLQYVIALYSRRLRDPVSNFTEYKNDAASLALSALTAEAFKLEDRAVSLLEEAMQLVNLKDEKPIKGESFNYFFDETVTLSLLLKAAIKLDFPSETITGISRKLLKMGNGSYWYRTASTAMAVVSLSSLSDTLSRVATVKYAIGPGELVEAALEKGALTLPITGEDVKLESAGLVAVSVNGETAIEAERIEPLEKGLKLERILRRKTNVPLDDGYILTTPQLEAPYIVANIRQLTPTEAGELEIDARKRYDGMEVKLENGELMLGEYHLGLKIYEGEVLGSNTEGFIMQTLEENYYQEKTVALYLVSLGANRPVRVGETVISEVKIVIPETAPYIVLEDMLPATGISVDETAQGDLLGYSKFYYFDYFWGYTFREARFDRVAYFFRYGGEYTTKTTWRVLTEGEFLIPAVQAWAMYDPAYSANTGSLLLEVK